MNPLFGIYIHWPYCLSKCPYCDFASRVCALPDYTALMQGYQRDLLIFKEKLSKKTLVTSIFFGGGTPSLMPISFLNELINFMQKNFEISADVEISLEANPDAISLEKMKALKNEGVNRISIGVQALNEPDLRFLGRKHSLKRALSCLEEAQSVFQNINMDLIYARPNQSCADWEKELQFALTLQLPHYSLYQLTIEENTPFGKRHISAAPEETAVALYELTDKLTTNAHITGYEISNYARGGYICRHNMTYWLGADYIGIGPSAQGRIGNLETTNVAHVEDWLKTPPSCVLLTDKEREEERIITGLRLRQSGFPCCRLNNEGVQKAVAYGWGTVKDDLFYPTLTGSLMLNQLILLVTPF